MHDPNMYPDNTRKIKFTQNKIKVSKQEPQNMGLHSDSLVTAADQGIIQYYRLWRRARTAEDSKKANLNPMSPPRAYNPLEGHT